MKNILASPSSATLKWAGFASFLLAVTFIVAPLIYLMGNLRDAMGPLSYDVADFLYGPVWAASLVTVVFTLRERMGEYAPRRMSLALLAACWRQGDGSRCLYSVCQPPLPFDSSRAASGELLNCPHRVDHPCGGHDSDSMALPGMGDGAGWVGRLDFPPSSPPIECAVFSSGTLSLFVYLLPDSEGNAAVLGVVVSIWQGILLWKAEPGGTQAPGISARPASSSLSFGQSERCPSAMKILCLPMQPACPALCAGQLCYKSAMKKLLLLDVSSSSLPARRQLPHLSLHSFPTATLPPRRYLPPILPRRLPPLSLPRLPSQVFHQ